MKLLTLIIHDNLKQDVADLLRNIEQVKGFTFSGVEGHGQESEYDLFLSNRDKVVGYTPRVGVDVVLEDKDVELVLIALRKSDIGLSKHTIYWTAAVEEYGRL